MKIQKLGADRLLLVLEASELTDESLRHYVELALRQSGITASDDPELIAYTNGSETLVFVLAGERNTTYFGFTNAEDLLNAAYEAGRLFPEAAAQLYKTADRFYLATPSGKAADLLREYTWDVREDASVGDSTEVLIAAHAFTVLSGRC